MTRTTIDLGIDLGTTNSVSAILSGIDVEIIKNEEQSDSTASVVWIDRRGSIFVGESAKARGESDAPNVAAEFKLLMGTSDRKVFERTGRSMSPEELSAEVLKSLKADIVKRNGEDVSAAVVTVPADFDLPQCDATRAAATLAGLRQAPLLQEPIAAALAYGFQSTSDKVFWLVYDLGGGTFDAAVVQLRDGELNVVNHEGDKRLGGKLIDWCVVDDLLIPAVRERYACSDFGKGSPTWHSAIAKLKHHAEEAKVRLSRYESTEISIDYLCDDDEGRPVRDFVFELDRADLIRLSRPLLDRSVEKCRQALAAARLSPGDIERTILVGGTTLAPYVRDHLAEQLAIPLDHSLDPITVVARGAAIFAGTQRLDRSSRPAATAGEYELELEYSPIGPDPDPLVGGRIMSGNGSEFTGYTVEFINHEAQPAWRSGRLPVTRDGAFTATLMAATGARNRFAIELCEPSGARCPTVPGELTYTVGNVDTRSPLTHSLGVALADNTMHWLMHKGTPLPASASCLLRTAVSIGEGEQGNMIRIPVMEGRHDRADRNLRVGTLDVTATEVRSTVPAGSEVQLKLEIDASRIVVAEAYIPLLDEAFEDVVDLSPQAVPEVHDLQNVAGVEKDRLQKVRSKVAEIDDPRARARLERVFDEQPTAQIDALVTAAANDPEAAADCGERVVELRAAIDEVEDALVWPALAREAEELLPAAREPVNDHGTAEDRRALERHETGVRQALGDHDVELLRRRMDELRTFVFRILDARGILQRMYFEELSQMAGTMSDRGRAQRLVEDGHRAMADDDIGRLRAINRELADLIPDAPRAPAVDSTVSKWYDA